jgi:hypothetical protein
MPLSCCGSTDTIVSGLRLVVNIIAGEAVQPQRRTAVFGMLQGCIMLGQGLGYLSKPRYDMNFFSLIFANHG